MKTRYDDTLGEKWKGDLYHKHTSVPPPHKKYFILTTIQLTCLANSDCLLTSKAGLIKLQMNDFELGSERLRKLSLEASYMNVL